MGSGITLRAATVAELLCAHGYATHAAVRGLAGA